MKGICDETSNFIKKFKSQLKDKGLLESVDDLAIEMLTRTHHQYIQASNFLMEHGMTQTVETSRGCYEKPFPQVKIAHDAHVQMLKILQEYGGTASSRKRVKHEVVEADTSDDMAGFLGIDRKTEKR